MSVLDAFSLEGKVALITGGNRGLGRALAQALGEAGATVGLTARKQESADAAAAELRELGLNAMGVAMEVSDRGDVDRAVTRIEDGLGPIDILVNNAGVSIVASAFDVTDEDWREIFSTNVDGVWNCSRRVAETMVGRGGSIVNIGSISAFIVNKPRWESSYLASKAAVHQLTKGLAAEWAPHDIRVNAVAPGYFLTEMSPVDQPEYYADCVEPAAMKRWGEPYELGPAVVFLASQASSFMTGSIVTIDGGYTLF